MNISDLATVTHPVSLSPDGNGVAKITGDYRRDPGRICHYDNGVKGECLPKNLCYKEQQELSGYNIVLEEVAENVYNAKPGTWKCPQHIDGDRRNRICCPNPGEENLLLGEEKALGKSRKQNYADLISLHCQEFVLGFFGALVFYHSHIKLLITQERLGLSG